MAVSPISAEQAKIDLAAEMGDRSFEQVREDTKAAWNEILGRLDVTASEKSDPDGDLQTLFYTHLYRMSGSPMNATSTSGTYRGLDGDVHQADGYTHYDGWGFWDDFRKYEILAIGYPEVFLDMAQSTVDLYATFASTGKGSLSNVTHSVPTVRFERAAVVVADAVAKGAQLRGLAQAWPALVSQSQGGYADDANVRRGYIANEVDDTLGTAYDDWAMATIADSLGKTEEAEQYRLRAANWTNLYKDDAVTLADGEKTGLIFPKSANGTWADADPERFEAGNVYQGTLWQYHWYTAGDMGGLIDKMGGEETTLDALSFMFGEHAPDDGSRMLHANANEIDLQAPYLFNYVGAPAKTQHWVRSIYTEGDVEPLHRNRIHARGAVRRRREFTPPVKTKVFKNSPQGFLPTMDNDTGTMSSTFVRSRARPVPGRCRIRRVPDRHAVLREREHSVSDRSHLQHLGRGRLAGRVLHPVGEPERRRIRAHLADVRPAHRGWRHHVPDGPRALRLGRGFDVAGIAERRPLQLGVRPDQRDLRVVAGVRRGHGGRGRDRQQHRVDTRERHVRRIRRRRPVERDHGRERAGGARVGGRARGQPQRDARRSRVPRRDPRRSTASTT